MDNTIDGAKQGRCNHCGMPFLGIALDRRDDWTIQACPEHARNEAWWDAYLAYDPAPE